MKPITRLFIIITIVFFTSFNCDRKSSSLITTTPIPEYLSESSVPSPINNGREDVQIEEHVEGIISGSQIASGITGSENETVNSFGPEANAMNTPALTYRNNAYIKLEWWSNYDNFDSGAIKKVLVKWSHGNGQVHEAWVTPILWDGINPIITTMNNPSDPPPVYAFRSTEEQLAASASAAPWGETMLPGIYGPNVQNWVDVWDRVARELEIYLPTAVKWVKHDTSRETFEALWGSGYNWDFWYPWMKERSFGLFTSWPWIWS